MGNKTHAFGTQLIWDGSPVGSLDNIDGVAITNEKIDVTTYDSPSGFKEYILGLSDVGEIPISGYLDANDSDGQMKLEADARTKVVRNASIVLGSTGATWEFQGYVSEVKIGGGGVGDAIQFSANITITGVPILTVSTSAGLTDLSLTGAALVPSFSASANEFFATATTETENVKVTPTAVGTIKVNGTTVTSGAASGNIALGDADSVTKIKVVVSESDKAPKNYTISVLRAAS